MYATERHTAIAAELLRRSRVGRRSGRALRRHHRDGPPRPRRPRDRRGPAPRARGSGPRGPLQRHRAQPRRARGPARPREVGDRPRRDAPRAPDLHGLDRPRRRHHLRRRRRRTRPLGARRRRLDLTVITNAVPIAATLQHSEHLELHLLGGRVRGLTSAAVGTATVEQIGALRPDIAFVGANGLSAPASACPPPTSSRAPSRRPTCAPPAAAVGVADAAKHGVEALMRFARLDEIDTSSPTQQPAGRPGRGARRRRRRGVVA